MHDWIMNALLASLLLLDFSNLSSALPTFDLFNATLPSRRYGVPEQKRDNVALRILPLGASIMSGTGSTTGNGILGYDVDMVGSLHTGTMIDHEQEAVPGDVLTQILARVPHSIGFKPNVVIINGGTNDGNGNVDIANVGSRMNDILNALWNADDMGSTCIMLSTLIPTTNANGAANRDNINSQYRALVTQRAAEGKCVYLADMDPGGQIWFDFDTDYLATESPHDKGHKMMAAVFYQSITLALADNRIVAPVAFEAGPATCDKFGDSGIDAGGYTQRGSGYSDGIYYHDSEEMGILWTATSSWDRDQWRFARLFDRNYDDLLAWVSNSDTDQTYAVWANSGDGNGKFAQVTNLTPDLLCDTAGLYFVDMTNDGLDDLVCIDADGNAYLSVNLGDGNRASGKTPTFKRASSSALIKSNEGYPQDRVRIVDIDGDGRGDYCVIQDNGDILFWRNGWIDPVPAYWGGMTGCGSAKLEQQPPGPTAEAVLRVLRVTVSTSPGVKASSKAHPRGQHLGMSAYITDTETNLRNRIHFARIYGPPTIFGNAPLQDYVFMQHTELSTTSHKFDMRVWKNTGGGATKLFADGNKYCNMMGHSNGMVDLVWTYSFGTMELYINRGKGSISDSDPDGYWDPSTGVIWTPPSNMDRRDLHLADWDGDGDCDIIYTNPDRGAVQVWLNNYPSTGKWDWTYLSNPAPGVTCSEKRGLGRDDLAVRVADITGNGRADYLCIQPDSTVSIGKDRANLRWADVDGDGKDDMLWIEKFSGDGYVWYNDGSADPSVAPGSSFSWRTQDAVAFAGNAAGSCIYYPDLDGNGRADEHFVLESFTNRAKTSLSPNCGLQDATGDDATTDGSLPAVPAGGSTTTTAISTPTSTAITTPTQSADPDFPSRSLAGNPNCPDRQNFMAPLNTVGDAEGGVEFCLGHWTEGIFPQVLGGKATENALAYISLEYSDGSNEAYGTSVADDGHHRYGSIDYSALVDTWSHFILSGDGWDGGVGRLEVGLVGAESEDIDIGKYYDSTPPVFTYNRGTDGKGILLGFYGRAGDRIVMLQPYFTNSGLDRVIMTDQVFTPSFESLNALPFEERMMEAVQSSYILFNNRTSEDVTMQADLYLEVTAQTSMNVGSQKSHEYGTELGWAVKGEIKGKIGTPEVEIGGSVEQNGKYVMKWTDTTLNSKEDTEAHTIRARYVVSTVVKAGQKVQCDVIAYQSRVNIAYTATATVQLLDGTSFSYPAAGNFVNAASSSAYTTCNDVDVSKTTDDAHTITESGTYCLDGTRVGDVDQSDDFLDQYCPLSS
ncbi:uncharacterized protein LY89DRAFT_739567 [Mollisia scopiformis]|uniref:SGNH hydrolase-type esterase domain-containing protein n=1 Tax=Mollisia scopiformis TaxID=149040 RepID=A0A194WUN1_MOLSC|nr:uncharacterized protein LY89DRAFT_739567 [Mollisia scopiformis]KUJ11379.1 hypothetical protein LY89DRAFT_739567 [Mollisia scopiformis]